MKTFKEQFATYEIALAIKELGFDEECLGYYRNDSKSLFIGEDSRVQKDSIQAPLLQQCIDWFREKHDIHIYIEPGFDNLGKPEIYQWEMKIRNRVFIKDGDFKSYEEAREQAILKAVKYLKTEDL